MILTPEKLILDFFKQFVSKHGYSPTITEIAKGIGYSSRGSASRYVKQLVNQGLLVNKGGKRGYELTEPELFQPFLGKIIAGGPLEAIPEPERVNFLDVLKIPGLYWLMVMEEVGDSMTEERIFPGWYVGIKPSKTAENGETIVALVDGHETTLKTVYQCKDYIELRPASKNPIHKPRRYAHHRVDIQGVVKFVLDRR